MAGDMHTPNFRPACWLDPRQSGNDPRSPAPRAAWAQDQAASCMDAGTLDARRRQIAHTPGCRGCARRIRAWLVERGHVAAHERVIANPQKRAAV